ncbi:MAG: DegT/DnrJ/EryC1/StrS family aminotransferase [Candidatus Krumholzibacteria bacterium]|jgi:dTDP-4-amino-4,6-dideoxygalactose transaminase|nr:DegT/DnrJ/EryC1/StrS family aminotransferase [Candidatus Krumholzibacteria bacterium]MDP6670039.1 DegT/DnrJ/EryC1/StrS family aminotransferase [Candidatus Krumholzibacteria bacterium]MDP6796789.1 DegT/DnrJ/EryC1/StrS family aminotransferase [Candidatus Krumholzibacteria bacterium]MDP7020781.1 DegT/DnrJ/EryC1/StrS family aminotransferase [Candidatus Krumholzibacteria bacterium]
MRIPQLDLKAQYDSVRDEIGEALSRVFENQAFILGEELLSFEEEVASFLGVEACLGVSSGSEALRMALAMLDIGPGDEVLLPSFTFFATAGSVVQAGASPVFVDVGEDFLMDPEDAARKLTGNTRAILPVHLYGLQADLSPFFQMAEQGGLAILEDAAQSLGARREEGACGCMGDAGCYSFFPSKNLGAAGDGGLLRFRDPELTERARRYRVHGEAKRYHHDEVGINARMDALQAAVLRVKLPHLENWNKQRRNRARSYEERFSAGPLRDLVLRPALPSAEEHVFHQYTLRLPQRDELKEFLAGKGISSAIYYPLPLHQQPCFSSLPGAAVSLPKTEKIAGEVLSLPIYPELSDSAVDEVVSATEEFYSRSSS